MTPDTVHDYGGNLVTALTLADGRCVFAVDPYHFRLQVIAAGASVRLAELATFTVYMVAVDDGVSVALADGTALALGDAVQVEDGEVEVVVVGRAGGAARLLVAGCRAESGRPRGVQVTRAAELKRVVKPWGHELWINGEHPSYACKEIALNRGFRSSLQYHRLKRETQLFWTGEARLHFKTIPECHNDRVTEAETGTATILPPATLDVPPGTLHRVEAVGDVLLFEVSTPHLDDVVRVSDDSQRRSGPLPEEHRGGPASGVPRADEILGS